MLFYLSLSHLAIYFYRVVSFQILFKSNENYVTVNDFNEGMEFSFRLSSSSELWIPVRFIYNNQSQENNEIYIGNRSNLIIRGYQVEQQEAIPLDLSSAADVSSTANVSMEICGINQTELAQFRWLQTSKADIVGIPNDVWILDNIVVHTVSHNSSCGPVLLEGFDTQSLE